MTGLDDSQVPSSRDLLASALGYAEQGWHVFPLRPGTKFPAVPNHKAADCDGTDPWCRHGHAGWEQRATTDPTRIERCWGRSDRRPPGIGIATGPSGLVVVDLDVPKPGDPDQRTGAQVLDELAAAAGPALPEPYTVATPSGGWHLYFHAPDGEPPVGNTAGRIGPHIDTRAGGGYVVAPPTVIPAGRYACTRPGDPLLLPDWIHHRLRRVEQPALPSRQIPPNRTTRAGSGRERPGRAARYVQAALDAEVARVCLAPGGERNTTLYVAAVALGQMAAGGLVDPAHAAAILEAAAERHVGIDDFTTEGARATIASGLREGGRKPRRLPRALAAEQLGGAA